MRLVSKMKDKINSDLFDEKGNYVDPFLSFNVDKELSDNDIENKYGCYLSFSIFNNESLLLLSLEKKKLDTFLSLVYLDKYKERIVVEDLLISSLNFPLSLNELNFEYNGDLKGFSIKKEANKLFFKGYYLEKNAKKFHFDFIFEGTSSLYQNGCGKNKTFSFLNNILYSSSIGYLSIEDKLINISPNSKCFISLEKNNYSNKKFFTQGVGVNKEKNMSFYFNHNHRYSPYGSRSYLYIDNIGYFLSDIRFYLPSFSKNKDNLLSEWEIRSVKDDVNVTFKPIAYFYSPKKKFLRKGFFVYVLGIYSGTFKHNDIEVSVEDTLGYVQRLMF